MCFQRGSSGQQWPWLFRTAKPPRHLVRLERDHILCALDRLLRDAKARKAYP